MTSDVVAKSNSTTRKFENNTVGTSPKRIYDLTKEGLGSVSYALMDGKICNQRCQIKEWKGITVW